MTILWGFFYQLQLESPSLLCSIVCFFFSSLARSYFSFCFLLILLHSLPGRQSPLLGRFFFLFICCQSLCLVVWPRLDNPFVSQNPIEFYVSHSPGQILSFAYTICSYGQIQISCTILSGSPSPLNHVKSYTLFTLIYGIHLLCDWSFRLDHLITYICNFDTFYLFLLWYSLSLWRFTVLLLEEIQFLS